MAKIKMYLDNFMEKLRRDNPDANWANLLTGIGILVLVAVFSVWYFGNSDSTFSGSGTNDDAMEQGENADTSTNNDAMEQNLGKDEVVVQAGEGLWHVAKRVCNNGELYNKVAAENNLSIWANLSQGQVLKVTCKYPEPTPVNN